MAASALFNGTPISLVIMVANIVVFLMIQSGRLRVDRLSSSYRTTIRRKEYRRLLTSMFTHQAAWHLVINLYSVANLCGYVERSVGAGTFAVVYFVTGIVGGFLSCLIRHRIGKESGSIGASGAICGVLGYYMVGLVLNYGLGNVSAYIISSVIPLALMTFNKRIDSVGHFTCLGCGIVLGMIL